ncbi:MAG: AAA family ATPase [Deltaproteobacteria bacterium]|nr:AAA family ATPase [Deltaproteobacteria bacterium]
MYRSYFGLHRHPFDREVPTEQLFAAPVLDELHARLNYLVETRGIGLVTGEPGSGKSTALRRLRDSLHPDQVRTLYVHDTSVNPMDFCRQVALELALDPPYSRALVFRAIQDEVLRLARVRHLSVLLIVDEAHALRPDVLGLFPMLANFDFDSVGRLAILFAGQAGMRQRLRLAHLEALAQRVTVRYNLAGFDRDTTRAYMEHRLRIAGCDRPLFAEPAIEAVFNASQGLMRRIDTLAHHALVAAASGKARIVDIDHVARAAEEVRP